MAIVTVFRQPLFQGLDALLQLGNQFISVRQLFLLDTDLFLLGSMFGSKLKEFVFCCHELTLQTFRLFGKSVGDLSRSHRICQALNTISIVRKRHQERTVNA